MKKKELVKKQKLCLEFVRISNRKEIFWWDDKFGCFKVNLFIFKGLNENDRVSTFLIELCAIFSFIKFYDSSFIVWINELMN